MCAKPNCGILDCDPHADGKIMRAQQKKLYARLSKSKRARAREMRKELKKKPNEENLGQ